MQTAKYLEKVGDRHKFQIYSIIFVCFKWIIVSLTVFLPSYLFVTPTFTCGDQFKVTESDACSRLDSCIIDLPYTITAHAGLYCDQKYVRDSIISSQFIGSIVGLILLSILADRLGRKIIIVCTLFFTTIGSMFLTLGANYINLPLMYIGLILMGFGGYSLSMVSYSYLSQINNDVWRQKSLILTYSFWALGEMALYPIIVLIQDWKYICFFIFIIPLIILMVMSIFIVETPQFYYVQKDYENSKFNNQQPLKQIAVPQETEGQEKQAEKITDTFTKKQFLLPLVVLSFAQICNNGIYYTTQYSLSQFGQSFQVNMLIIGSLELVSCLITNFYCERMYRKRWIMTFMITAGVIGVIDELTVQSSDLEIALIGISRLCNTFSFALFSLITTQSFPTSIRSTGTGVSEAMSNLGNMAAPFLVTISDDIGVKAVFIGGFVCIAGGLCMSFVKETKKKQVPANPLLSEQEIDEQEKKQKKQRTITLSSSSD